ncbi:MAG: 6-phosphofructokinase [Bacteroides sp.]|nr:MAG: 6-phosphofructokinase [Bacteroides sp.]
MNNINIGVLTSGGDAPGMNACIRAIVRTGIHYNMNIIGIRKGYEGLINNDFYKLNIESVANIIHKGGTILKTARSQDFINTDGMQKSYENLIKNNINVLIAIGGNGTLNGIYKFHNKYEIPVIFIPATIDNNLYGTDITIGYDTAINTVTNIIDKIRDTAESHDRLFFVEVMGKNTGHIAINTGISSGAGTVILPKYHNNLDHLFEHLLKSRRNKSSKIIIISEHNNIGNTFEIAKKVKNHFSSYDIKVTILGHVQRGGKPTCRDRIIASKMGYESIRAIIKNIKNIMIGIINDKIKYSDLNLIINKKKDNVDNIDSVLNMIDILSS